MALTPEEAVIALAAQMIVASTSEENQELEALEKIPLFIEYKEKINLAELLEKMKQGETTRENCINALKSASKDTQLDALGFAWIAMLADGKIDASEIELIEEVARPLGLEAEEVSDRVKEINATATGEINERIRRGTGETETTETTETTEEAIPVEIIVDKEPSLIGIIFYFIKSIVISAIIMLIIAFVSVELLEIIDKPLNEMEQVAFFSLTLVLAIFWFRNGLKSKKENRAQQIKDKEIRDKEVSEKERKEVRKRGERREQERIKEEKRGEQERIKKEKEKEERDKKMEWEREITDKIANVSAKEAKEIKEKEEADGNLIIEQSTYLERIVKEKIEEEKIRKEQEYIQNKKDFFPDNKLTILPNGNIRDENFEEYELEEERGDFIVYKPEGMKGKRAYIKTDSEKNYLAWSGPIKIEDKSKFLRGDFEKATKEESQPIEEAPVQEQEVENIEVKQEKESETSDANLDITARLNKITKLYDEGILTKEEFQMKSEELISKM